MDWAVFSDEELIGAYRAGHGEESLGELFRRYRPRVANWCTRFTQDRESSPDLAQDILLRAYRSLHTYRGDSRFSTWLYVIARNQCSSAMQKKAGQPSHVDSSVADSMPGEACVLIHRNLELGQLSSRKWRLVMDSLTRTEAHIMMMHYGEDVPLGDITRQLGLTNKSGAKAYIVSARRKLNSPAVRDRADRLDRFRASRSEAGTPDRTETFARPADAAGSRVPLRIAV